MIECNSITLITFIIRRFYSHLLEICSVRNIQLLATIVFSLIYFLELNKNSYGAINATSWSTCVAIAAFVILVDQPERSIRSIAFGAFRSIKWTAAIIILEHVRPYMNNGSNTQDMAKWQSGNAATRWPITVLLSNDSGTKPIYDIHVRYMYDIRSIYVSII